MKHIFMAIALIALTVPLLWSSPAGAASVTERQAFQRHRIQEGLADGSLTRREYRVLEREQARIEYARRRAWSDGRMQPWEYNQLQQMLDRANDHIRDLKHNGINRS